MAKLTDDQLIDQIERLERQAIGYWTGEIASEQAKAMRYYLGQPFGTEEQGRSAVVSSDVWDVVEGLAPIVLKPFVASDDVVKFNPLGPDDEDAAQQESEYINWVVTQRNDSFNQIVAWVKTGLLQKNGVVKYWWEKSEQALVERYFGVPEDLLALLAQDKGVTVVERSEAGPDAMGQPLFDVALRYVEEVGCAKYKVLPPEEFLISKDATSPNPQEASFCQHRRMVTIGELRDMGYDVADDVAIGSETTSEYTEQYQARRDQEEYQRDDDGGNDPTRRRVMFRESYLQVDYDGDGKPELRKVCIVGNTLLDNEETEEMPFCAWTPYPQPHKFYGRCPADETLEIQLIKSTLWRQSLDNIYTINNNRVFANESVNINDLIDNQIAGVVRVSGTGPVNSAVFPAPITPIGAVVQPMIEYLDSAKENRTGFTRYNQGSDGESLNKTATGIRLIKESAGTRTEMISRAFAEQGLAPLMRGVHGLCRRHATKDETIRLRGKWVPIDPRSWKKRMDLTVSVGLGTSDQQMRMTGIQMLMDKQAMLMPIQGLVTPKNWYESASKMAEIVGFKNPEQFFTAPPEDGQQQELSPQVKQALEAAQMEIQELQGKLQEAMSGIQAEQVKGQNALQLEQVKSQTQAQVEALKQQAQQSLQAMKDEAAHDREEMKSWTQILLQKMQPPPELAASVAEDTAEDD